MTSSRVYVMMWHHNNWPISTIVDLLHVEPNSCSYWLFHLVHPREGLNEGVLTWDEWMAFMQEVCPPPPPEWACVSTNCLSPNQGQAIDDNHWVNWQLAGIQLSTFQAPSNSMPNLFDMIAQTLGSRESAMHAFIREIQSMLVWNQVL